MISASSDTLLYQAPATVNVYVRQGMELMEEVLPKLTPTLQVQFLTMYVQACTADFTTAVILKELEEIVPSIVGAMESRREYEE